MRLLRVKVSTNFPEWPLILQTPSRSGVWGDCRFYINDPIDECDYWVVYEGLLKAETTACPPDNVVLITGEPPSIRTYSAYFLNQFAAVVTCNRELPHPRKRYVQQSHPWHIGRHVRGRHNIAFSRGYDELSRSEPEKSKLISVISSDKAFTEGHHLRLRFAVNLLERFEGRIDFFGRGLQDFECKWDAIAPYKYHVVIENGSFPDHFTEKLSDCYLAGAYPFYYGCTNIEDYFPAEAFTRIDIRDPESALLVIEEGLESDLYGKYSAPIREAKELVLNRYNLFAAIAEWAREAPISPRRPVSLTP
jgi:hypothetical protein